MNYHDGTLARADETSTGPSSPTRDEVYQICLRHLKSGELEQAAARCREGLASDANHAGLLHLMAGVALLNGDYDAAINWAGRALTSEMKATYLATFGTALLGKGMQAQAFEAFQRAVALDPVDPSIWENFGNALNRVGQADQASLCFLIARAYQKLPFLGECGSVPRNEWNALTAEFNPHLRTRARSDEARDPIHCFWSNVPLSDMSRLSLQSMVRQGHPVRLYTYDNLAAMQARVPSGVMVVDAASLVPAAIYQHAVLNSDIRYFSDIFRYAVLHELGGWWLDTDIVLVKPLDFGREHVFSTQWSGVEQGHVCVGDVMRAPKGSVHMANLYALSLQRMFSENRVEYGAVGPLLLSEYLLVAGGEELQSSILPPSSFNAIDRREVELFAVAGRAGFELLSDPRVTGVHLWGRMWAERGLRFDAVPEESVAGYLKKLVLEPNWLTQLAAKYDSDKGATAKGDVAHHYTRVYHELFRSKALEPVRILEIGLCRGRVEGRAQDQVPSLQMWLDYFPNAEIIGVDIEDFSWFSHPRVRIHRLDQGDRGMLEELARKEKPLDIIIDDGSHASVHQHLTLGVLFPALKPGGLFVIEGLDWQPPEIPSGRAPLVKDVLNAMKQGGAFASNVMTEAEAKLISDEVDEILVNDSFRELISRGLLGGLGVLRRRA
ncbi:glycosyltransferase [Bradyrhizobium sp. CCBAU 51745]|uniref:glycosyltransferase n=1 Tax=Bradyrhizobium sp. CCBAU 51745 TaxID=1325099 RepID=UPI002305A897|nr:glycosyltransferase [Bradyrhizobium sp. CCBAU 51745]